MVCLLPLSQATPYPSQQREITHRASWHVRTRRTNRRHVHNLPLCRRIALLHHAHVQAVESWPGGMISLFSSLSDAHDQSFVVCLCFTDLYCVILLNCGVMPNIPFKDDGPDHTVTQSTNNSRVTCLYFSRLQVKHITVLLQKTRVSGIKFELQHVDLNDEFESAHNRFAILGNNDVDLSQPRLQSCDQQRNHKMVCPLPSALITPYCSSSAPPCLCSDSRVLSRHDARSV